MAYRKLDFSKEILDLKKQHAKQKLVLGSHGFQDWLYDNHVTDAQKRNQEFSLKQRKHTSRPKPKHILEVVAFSFDETISNLRRSSNQERLDRSIAIYLLRHLIGMPHKEIAKWMKCSNSYAVAKVLQRFQSRIVEDSNLKKQVESIRRGVLSHVKT